MRVQAERDPRVKRRLRLARRVDVRGVARVHRPRVVVDRRVDAAVPDGLGDDELHVPVALAQAELLRDVVEGDGRVRQRHSAEAGPDDVAAESRHQVGRLVRPESSLVGLLHGAELLEVAEPDRGGELEVREERPLRRRAAGNRGGQVLLLRDLAEQEPDDGDPLGELQGEPLGELGRLAVRLGQALLGVRVLQLDRSDASQVVEVPALLLVAPARGELRLAPQLLSLVVHVVVQVVTHEQVQDRLLPHLVESKRGDAVERQ